MATTWNPSDKSASITLSNGNLTMAGTGTGDVFVRSTGTAYTLGSSNKIYLEVYVIAAPSGYGLAVGIANANATFGSGPGTGTADDIAYYVNENQYFISGSGLGGGADLQVSQWNDFAIDTGNKKIWCRPPTGTDAGKWNGSGTADPATNTGGVSFSSLNAGSYMFMAGQQAAYSDSCTVNFGASGFAHTKPAGFSAWDVGAPAFDKTKGFFALAGR